MVVGVEWCQHCFYGEVEQDTIGKKQPFYQVHGLCLVGVTGWCFLFWQEPLNSLGVSMSQMPAKMIEMSAVHLEDCEVFLIHFDKVCQQFPLLIGMLQLFHLLP